MQYVRRRIQRVSGVTVRDERIVSRDFSARPLPEERDEARHPESDRPLSQAEVRARQRLGAMPRERT